jgi:lipid-A-disaccharide synthase
VGDAVAKRFLFVTGEASGDLHAARLVTALRALGPCVIRGIAGPRMRAAGVECLIPAEELAVVGFSEIIGRLPRLLAARRRILAEFARWQPHVVVLVDYPGFNLRLGPELKRRGANVFYFIAPQVWAWHPERAAEMARWVDHLAVVFPFEEPIFRAAGVAVTHVGHPLLDEFAPEVAPDVLRAELGMDPGARLLGLLPGSRAQEIARHLPVLVAAARSLAASRPDLHVVLALPPGVRVPAGWPATPRWHALSGRTRAVMAAATACAVASGTATLETALFGTPLVVLYRTGRVNHALARRFIRIPRIGLPNIVAGEDVVPELLQDALTPEALAGALTPLLDDPEARAAARRRLATVGARLGGPGASARAAELLWSMAA